MMFTNLVPFFSDEYKARIVEVVSELRETFEKEMDGKPEIAFGPLFYDDGHAIHAFICQFERGRLPETDSEMRTFAQVKERLVPPYKDCFRAFAWAALQIAANTDHYRLNEKDYE